MKAVSRKKLAKVLLTIITLIIFILAIYIMNNYQSNEFKPKPDTNPVNNNDKNLNDELDEKPVEEVPEKLSPAEEILSQMTLEEKIGQMFIVGFSGTEPDYYIDKMISKRNIAGVILMKHNILNREQLIELTNSLQLKSATTNLAIPLFIATDQEGGEIVRIRVAGVSEFSAQADIENKEQAFKLASNRGKELRELGININFSPVLDYISDKESFLYSRTFQTSLAKTTELGSAMVKGYQKYIISSPKHFLGHPDTIGDPHSSSVISNFSLEDIQKRISIFKKVNEESSPAMVMTSHIVYNNIDPQHPCSLSSNCINNYLKDSASLPSNSLVITDAMEMGAIADNYLDSEAAVMAIKAGNDILLYTKYPEKQVKAYEAIIEAVNKKEIDISQINSSVLKILNIKKQYLY